MTDDDPIANSIRILQASLAYHEECARRTIIALTYLVDAPSAAAIPIIPPEAPPAPAPRPIARSLFKRGQRVRLSTEGINAGGLRPHWKGPRSPTGVVAGFSYRNASVVHVLRDGAKTRRGQSAAHWEPIPEEAAS